MKCAYLLCDKEITGRKPTAIYCSRGCNAKAGYTRKHGLEQKVARRLEEKRQRGLGKALSASPKRTTIDRVIVPFIRPEWKFLYENVSSGG